MDDPSMQFEQLEALNSDIDVWIDEEEYARVDTLFTIKKKCEKNLVKAFEHETCTKEKDKDWSRILSDSFSRPFNSTGSLTKSDLGAWAPLFWAKVLRAKIQNKGTDCYFRRLDEVVWYLERNLPLLEKNHSNQRLAVIYLLEMAAAGEGVDQRSFADRARRTLKRIYKDPNDDSYKFYDMVARYSRGVGYFHDGSFRKAVLDFNYIIHELKEHLEKEFYKKRKAYQLLYLPSILYRAEIQNELQLAYHASDTVSDEKLKSLGASEHSPHKENKIHLIRAEALQQMSLWDDAWKELSIVARSFGTRLDSYETAIPISALPGEQYSNIKSKLQSLVEAEHQWYLKNSKLNQTTFIQYLTNFKDFLNKYAESARHQEPNRIGYLKEVANFLNWLAKRYQDSNKTSRKKIGQVLKDLFDSNKANLILKEEDEFLDCPCDNSTISLWGLKSEEYQVFYENMLELLDNVSGLTDIDSDRKEFILNLTIHEGNNDKLHWRIRKFNLSREDVEFHDEWIDNRCLSERQPPKDSVFDGLLECVSTPSRYCQTKQSLGRDFLVGQDYETIMNAWDEHFINHLKVTTIHAPYKRSLHFLGLQRWNSTSPAQGRSLGGGYLIYHTDNTGKIDLGVAIDPGFDFVRNLFHAGFSLADIDVVVMSHAHVDHVRDFESMISLLLELKKRKRLQLKVHAVMTLGVYKRLEFLIESPGFREFIEPYIIDIEKEINNDYPNRFDPFVFYQNYGSQSFSKRVRFSTRDEDKSSINLTIEPILSYHDDHTGYSDTFGFKISVAENNKKTPSLKYCLGYTSDTSWHYDFREHFAEKKFDVLLVHLGSLLDRGKEERRAFSYYANDCERCFELVSEKNHPYIMGMLHFLNDLSSCAHVDSRKPLVLLSEFGEEMRGGIRLDLFRRIRNTHDKFNILPIDVGLDIMLAPCEEGEASVRCVKCDSFVSLSKADFVTYGHDEALFCVCTTCLKSTPHDVLEDRLRTLYEVGRELRY